MSVIINNTNGGVIEISSNINDVPRCYYGGGGTSGKFYPMKDHKYLIQIGGDDYEVYWENLVVGDIQPITFLDAGRLLGEIFTVGTTTSPTNPPATTIQIVQSTNFDIAEDEDFTIEWFMYLTGDAYYPRAYSIGAYPSANNAVSIESGLFIWWANSGTPLQVQMPSDLLFNWHHIAIVRNSGLVTIYCDGVFLESTTYPDAIPAPNNLYLGSENVSNTYLDGKMSNFRWTLGLPVYTEEFTPPTAPLEALEGTTLLMLQGESLGDQLTDNSGAGNTITNLGATYSTSSPFNRNIGSTLFGNY